MAHPRRRRCQPTDDWQQLRLVVTSRAQETYELLRPIVLFGQPPRKRAAETGVSERTLRRKAARFAQLGMQSLFADPAPTEHDGRQLPAAIRRAIVALKAEYPPLRPYEIATICRSRFHRPVGHHTVARVLATEPLPVDPPRRFPRYHEIADPVRRRRAIVCLAGEGWTPTAIAGYLEVSRPTVYEVIERWNADGWPGLSDRPLGPHAPARKVDLATMRAIRRLQENPRRGAFRVHSALTQQGIDLSPRTCGTILARHRALRAPRPTRHESEPHAMPFAASRWHQWWSVDVRYLEDHALDLPKPVYVIAVLENFSRAILASAVSPRQDLAAYLIVLHGAIARYGVPEGLVSDSGGIFRATHAQAIYAALGIDKREIDRGQPWQNYIEAMFGVMRRMADDDVARATTWADLHAVHDRFVHNYNYQPHFAHQHLPKGRRAPAAVQTWVRGRPFDPGALDRIFQRRETRRIRKTGFVRFRHWRLYGERGLAGVTVALWMWQETLTLEFSAETLAQYRVALEADGHHLRAVDEPRLFALGHPSSQPLLPPLAEIPWQPASRLVPYRPRRRCGGTGEQAPLFDATPTAAVG